MYRDLKPENVLVSASKVTSKFYPSSINDNFDYTARDITETKFKDKVKYGKNVLIGDNVTLGSNCLIGHNTIIEQNVSIGDNCWICSGAIILPGTEIGPNSVVGANSLVQGIFGDSEVLVGCPARSKNKK